MKNEKLETLRQQIEADLAELFALCREISPAMTHLTPYCTGGKVTLWGCNGGAVADASTLKTDFAGMLAELSKLAAKNAQSAKEGAPVK